jgi:hypothetical protein
LILTFLVQWLSHERIEKTQIYAHAYIELKRKLIALAAYSTKNSESKFKSIHLYISNEEMVKRLYELKSLLSFALKLLFRLFASEVFAG